MKSDSVSEKEKKNDTPQKQYTSLPCIRLFFKPLSPEKLKNITIFQYKSTSESIFYNYVMSPTLNKYIVYFPTWIAPNLITIIGLLFTFISAFVVYLESGFDFSKRLKSSTCYIIGINQMIYSILDNLDGKQARRTGSASPFGLLMDHGCDVFTSIFTAFNLSHLYLVGNEDIFSLSAFFGMYFGFYSPTFEEYKIGEMHFGYFSGVDEGNFLVFLCGVFSGYFGQDWTLFKLFDSNPKIMNYLSSLGIKSITLGKLSATFIFLYSIETFIELIVHTWQKQGFKEVLKNLWSLIIFINVGLFPAIFILFDLNIYQRYAEIIYINISLLFARVILNILIKIISYDELDFPFMCSITNILLFVSEYLVKNGQIDNFNKLMNILAICQTVELVYFIVFRALEITNYMGIKIFKIKPKIN